MLYSVPDGEPEPPEIIDLVELEEAAFPHLACVKFPKSVALPVDVVEK